MTFQPPEIPKSAFFALYFSSPSDLTSKLTRSAAKKDGVDEQLAKYDGVWSVEVPPSSPIDEDYGLVLKSRAKHSAISVLLDKPVDFTKDQFVVQYEVKFQTAMECGGAYVKLLSEQPSLDLKTFHDRTPYTIMFGPDKCGNDHKLHFIFRHKSPITGEYEEKHAKKPKAALDRYFSDQKTHLYTLVLNADNTYEMYVDQTQVNYGSLLSDVEPPVNPQKEVEDSQDKKPEDWDDREKIVDPEARKPDDWDETQPEMIEDKDAVKPEGWLEDALQLVPDPSSVKPSDWDADMDGEWEPPKIDNPQCKEAPGCGQWTAPKIKNPLHKGKWTASMLNNPNYKGVWKARRVANPNYFEDAQPYRRMTPIVALGLELWSMTDEIVFDNFFIGSSKADADEFAAKTWYIKSTEERKADPRAQSVIDAIQEVTQDKPWVWAVVALVIGLPVVLIFMYCCTGNSSAGTGRVPSARQKKTDEPTPDETTTTTSTASTTITEEEKTNGAAGGHDEVNGRTGKAALESDSESEKEDQLPETGGGDKSTSSSDEEEVSAEKVVVTKRRLRKE